jgi:hypothetical protein
VIFNFKNLISAEEDMKIKKNTFSTLVLELFFASIANCKKLKIQKSTSPTIAWKVQAHYMAAVWGGSSKIMQIFAHLHNMEQTIMFLLVRLCPPNLVIKWAAQGVEIYSTPTISPYF